MKRGDFPVREVAASSFGDASLTNSGHIGRLRDD
jgi:hypothetical protein